VWQKYNDATEKSGNLHTDSDEVSDNFSEWFRENAYLAAQKLEHDVSRTVASHQSTMHKPFDMRLTFLARAGKEFGKPPKELENDIKSTSLTEASDPSTYFHLYTIAEPMPLRDPNKKISVVLRKDVVSRGANPDIKDTSFVRTRQILLDCQGKCEETVMAEMGNISNVNTEICKNTISHLPESWKSTLVTEGSSSNFFVIYRVPRHENKFILRTAGNDRVLGGTVRELVFKKYSVLPVEGHFQEPFKLEISTDPPMVDEIQDWVGCFLTSTSRLILPISEVILPVDSGSTKTIEKFIECDDDRIWPRPLATKNDDETASTTAVVYRFETGSDIMQTIVRDGKSQILAHSQSLRIISK
jgi:hypothetical protein